MTPLRICFTKKQKEYKKPWHVLERDYIQSWILSAIAQDKVLSLSLVFKGGTALKKCYFGNYRFSEDLDFSALSQAPKGDALEKAMNNVCIFTMKMLGEYAPIKLTMERYREKNPHPQEQEAFTIRCQFPWQREPLCKVLIEVTQNESLAYPPIHKEIIHGFEEKIHDKILVYSLEEIVLEKLRAILQHTKKIHEQEWSRSRARDYYDLWHITKKYGSSLKLSNTKKLLEKKCSSKNVFFINAESFFAEAMIKNVKNTWKQWLGALTSDLPDCDALLNDLKKTIADLLKQ